MMRTGDHVRVLESRTWGGDGPPVGAVGTIGLVVEKKHDDWWDTAVVIFDWDGRLAKRLPKGTWFVFDNGLDVETVQHCAAPAPCICNPVP